MQVLVGFGAVGAFAAVFLPPGENARRDAKQIVAGSTRNAPRDTARAGDELLLPALDVDRSTAAVAPPHIQALQLEPIEDGATPDNQPRGVAGGCVSCPLGSIPENETNCGLPVDTTNGGCNSVPAVFSRITCGTTYCGTAAFNGVTRDTDWYEVVVDTATQFTWTVSSEFASVIGLVEMNNPGSADCGDVTGNLNPIAQIASCSTGSVTVCLPPGTHWFFVAPVFVDLVNCGATYTASLTCTTCPDEACCLPDGSCRDATPADCAQAGGVSLGADTRCLGDGNENQVDDACEGACCVPQTCNPGTCANGFSNCEGNPNCFCFEVAEGGGNCALDFSCANPLCPNGTSDCPVGEICYMNSCCGPPTCGPSLCLTPSTAAPVDPGAGPTASGGQRSAVSGGIPDCIVIDRDRCTQLGGTFEGNGTFCTHETCLPPEACCLPNGTCDVTLPVRCREAHGVPMGPGSQCVGDNNGNQIDDACEPAREPCGVCGPGEHWMHNPPCPPGADIIPTGAVVGISINGDCLEDTNLVLSGTAAVRRSGPRDVSVNYPGLRLIDDHFDVIDTEMVSMSLTGGGFTLTAGAGLGQGGVLRPSLGAIFEEEDDPLLADSFFDVFFEILPDGGAPLYNQDAVLVRANNFDCLPPDATYVHLDDCLPLYTSPIPGQGAHVAFLTSANHSTFPACGDPGTGSCYVPHDPPFCDNVECCKRVCDRIPECCELGWKGECAELARRICVQPTVVKWESVVTHTRTGVTPVDIPLEITEDGLFSEPRGGVRRIVVTFDLPIDPASATEDNINICGLKPGNVPGTFVPVDLSGIVMTVKTSDGDTKLEINFNPRLPDFVRYLITLKGIYGPFGPLKPGDGGLSRTLWALQGDTTGDDRVNATDVGGIRSLVPKDPINPAIVIEVRADINNDKRINATDVSGARSLVTNPARDARNIPIPDCPLCGDGIVDSPEECESDSDCISPAVCIECRCVRNPECTGATCFNSLPCNPTTGCSNPFCATTAEGGGLCAEGTTPCAGLALCTTTADCTATGALCAVETCCGGGVCLEPSTFCEPPDECFKEAVCAVESNCTNDVCNCFFTAAGNTRCFANDLPGCTGAPCATDANCAAGEACSNSCCGLTCAPLCGGAAAAAPVKDYSAGSVSGSIPTAPAVPTPTNANPARSGNIE